MAKLMDVFTPTATPTFTYVDRTALGHEKALQTAMSIPNMVVSVSGPSKSGKTVLIKKVVKSDEIIQVSGSAIRSPEDLWKYVLGWVEAPSQTVSTIAGAKEIGASAGASGKVGIPIVAEGGISGQVAIKATDTKTEATTVVRAGGLPQVIAELGKSSYAIFIDDFHYIPRDVQTEIAKQIKSAAEGSVRVITASVPHRSDDVVRGNGELRGRVLAVDLEYWDVADLKKIAELGFKELNVDLSPSVVMQMAEAAFGSPQLMQIICLHLCLEAGISETWREHKRLDVDDAMLDRVRNTATAMLDYSSMVEAMHSGAKVRGTERKQFKFTDGTEGDVYRSILLAIASDPPKLSLPYDELHTRIRTVCADGSAPVGSSITESLKQIEAISKTMSPAADVLEYDEDVLSIVEPYFLFYLRFSSKLAKLGKS